MSSRPRFQFFWSGIAGSSQNYLFGLLNDKINSAKTNWQIMFVHQGQSIGGKFSSSLYASFTACMRAIFWTYYGRTHTEKYKNLKCTARWILANICIPITIIQIKRENISNNPESLPAPFQPIPPLTKTMSTDSRFHFLKRVTIVLVSVPSSTST